MKTTLRPHFRIRTKFALASTTLLLSLLFAPPARDRQRNQAFSTRPLPPPRELIPCSPALT